MVELIARVKLLLTLPLGNGSRRGFEGVDSQSACEESEPYSAELLNHGYWIAIKARQERCGLKE